MIRIESPDLNRLAIGAKAFPKPLRATMRKELAGIGKEAAQAAKDKIRAMPVKGDVGYRQGTDLRADIAKAIRVNAGINTRAGASVKIRVAETAALKQHRRFRAAQLLDKGVPFRHRVYGKDVWVNMPGYPYFRRTVEERAPQMRVVAAAALREAIVTTMPNVRP